MASKDMAVAKTDPQLERALLVGMALDGLLTGGGGLAWYLLHSSIWFYAGAIMGTLAFVALYMPAYLQSKARTAAEAENAPIVEDPHGKL